MLVWSILIFSRSAQVLISAATTTEPAELVEILAGTRTADGESTSNGNTIPQIKRPFGFNDWAPMTTDVSGWWFLRDETSFLGMRCTHQPSPWMADYGTFTISPQVQEGFQQLSYSPQDSVFRPYRFSTTVLLDSKPNFLSKPQGINFEFAPTSRAAVGRMTFPAGTNIGRLRVAVPAGEFEEHSSEIIGRSTVFSDSRPAKWTGLFFVLRTEPKASSSSCRELSCTLELFNPKGAVNFYVGTSFISKEQAEINLEREIGSKLVKDVAKEGKEEWNQLLRRIHVDALDHTQLRVFYTNLWKSSLFPRYLHEVDANGTEIHYSPYTGDVSHGKLVADSGFWDAYRTVYPLQSVINPENLGMQIDGWLNAYKEAEWLPQWPSPGQRESMVSTMGDVVLADAIAKQSWGVVTGFSSKIAYEAIRKDAFSEPSGSFGRQGLDEYIRYGYLSNYIEESVSRSQNYYVADAAIARAAAILGETEDSMILRARSLRYPSLFNNDTLFFQSREFEKHFNPLEWGGGFTEAGGWQYRFYVPHDVDGLKALYGGTLCKHIQEMFEFRSGESFLVGTYYRVIHEMKEMADMNDEFGLYAHSNQPVHDILWIAKRAGCDDVADRYLRKVLDKLYTLDGWCGDEDNGEMASWYVLSALGLFSLAGAKDEMIVGSPAFYSATVQLPGGKVLEVQTHNQSKGSVYVREVVWTPAGASPQRVYNNTVRYTELMKGGKLSFVMAATPKSFGMVRNEQLEVRMPSEENH